MRRYVIVWCVVAAACGGKIDGNVEGGLPDATASTDGRPDDRPPTIKDAGPLPIDAGGPSTCGPAAIAVGSGGAGCKIQIQWQCGPDSYDVSAGCSMLDGLSGTCSKNGLPTKMIKDPSCNCQDANNRFIFAKLCGFPYPP